MLSFILDLRKRSEARSVSLSHDDGQVTAAAEQVRSQIATYKAPFSCSGCTDTLVCMIKDRQEVHLIMYSRTTHR